MAQSDDAQPTNHEARTATLLLEFYRFFVIERAIVRRQA